MAIIQKLSVDEILKEEEEQGKKKESLKLAPVLSLLVQRVLEDFDKALSSRYNIEQRMVDNLYAFKGEYTPTKLKSIKEDVGGSETYIPLINIKARAARAWLSDIYFSGEEIFSLKPTPIPDLPDEEESKIQAQIEEEFHSIVNKAEELNAMTGGQFDHSFLVDYFKKRQGNLRDEYLKRIKQFASDKAEFEFKRIKDQLTEGGFYKALNEIISDIVIFPTAILKGPILRKERRSIYRSGSGYATEEVTIPTYSRVNPFDIYPAPNSSNVDDGYLIEVLHLSPEDLYSLSIIPGYDRNAILEILSRYHGGRLGRAMSYLEHIRRELEDRSNYDRGNTIDVIEYWGVLRGSELLQANLNLNGVSDQEYYSVCLWVCDDKIIKAMLNPDPLGSKPYSVASFIEVPDSFWGLSVADVLCSIQEAVNAFARATVNNAVFSSGPMIERNVNRLEGSKDKKIYPYQIFDVSESSMNSAPAIEFYQPLNVSQAIAVVMQLFQKMADEYSGVPAYAHGDVTVGGAGRTSSGLHALMANAARGIKDVVKNIDDGIIEPTVLRQYFFNLRYLINYPEEVPDLNIQARGSISLMEKQSQATRMLEFLQITSNPVDMQIVGVEGRKYMLEKIAKNVGLDPDEIFKQAELQEIQRLLTPLLQQMQGQMSQTPAPQEGNELGRQASRMGLEVGQNVGENG
jgi:hypothetical protein